MGNRMKQISKLTNSEIGSSHWLNTLLGNILHVGEYMLDHARLTPEQMKGYGQTCYHGSREILDWFGIHPIEVLENEERYLLKKLKEKYNPINKEFIHSTIYNFTYPCASAFKSTNEPVKYEKIYSLDRSETTMPYGGKYYTLSFRGENKSIFQEWRYTSVKERDTNYNNIINEKEIT